MEKQSKNSRLVREILQDVERDMTDEEILTLLAGSKVSENPAKETGKAASFGQRAADGIA